MSYTFLEVIRLFGRLLEVMEIALNDIKMCLQMYIVTFTDEMISQRDIIHKRHDIAIRYYRRIKMEKNFMKKMRTLSKFILMNYSDCIAEEYNLKQYNSLMERANDLIDSIQENLMNWDFFVMCNNMCTIKFDNDTDTITVTGKGIGKVYFQFKIC